ncbi:MAG: NeuD/PglB/VioB family sugar acetyltransferase [Chloroflexi bacterium]|nr:NeuD/PglB/VioB family sugar acetyltransferase [Chloroflexota bacterium]
MDENISRALIVVGAGGHAREVASYVRTLQAEGEPIILCGFVDDHRFDDTYEGAPLLGGVEQLGDYLRAHRDVAFSYMTAVGDNRVRARLVRRVEGLGAENLRAWTMRHPLATIGDPVSVGVGTCIAPGAIVTAHVTIGEHCIVNVGSSISHDTAVASFVNVNPGAAICGSATLGEGCFIGASATVIDNVRIGEWSVVGAGAVVIDDVPSHVTVVGVPARIIQRHGRGVRVPPLAG